MVVGKAVVLRKAGTGVMGMHPLALFDIPEGQGYGISVFYHGRVLCYIAKGYLVAPGYPFKRGNLYVIFGNGQALFDILKRHCHVIRGMDFNQLHFFSFTCLIASYMPFSSISLRSFITCSVKPGSFLRAPSHIRSFPITASARASTVSFLWS